MARQKSGARISVADGAGGVRAVEDHRFDEGPWPIQLRVAAQDAEAWMAHVNAETTVRGWSSATLGQQDAGQNSGSLTLHLAAGQTGPTIEIAWEKDRNARMDVRLRSGGEPPPALALVWEFVRAIDDRVREGRTDTM